MKKRNKDRLLSFSIPFLILSFFVMIPVSLRILNQLSMPEQLRQREQLKLITADLELDMSRDQVFEIINKHKWPLKRVSEDKNEIWLSTKPQLLATDWKVRLFFKDGHLNAIKYCNADNVSKHPDGAPPDIKE